MRKGKIRIPKVTAKNGGQVSPKDLWGYSETVVMTAVCEVRRRPLTEYKTVETLLQSKLPYRKKSDAVKSHLMSLYKNPIMGESKRLLRVVS